MSALALTAVGGEGGCRTEKKEGRGAEFQCCFLTLCLPIVNGSSVFLYVTYYERLRAKLGRLKVELLTDLVHPESGSPKPSSTVFARRCSQSTR